MATLDIPRRQIWLKRMVAIATLSFLINGLGHSQLVQSQPASITLSPQFSPNPIELKGTAGGATAVGEIVGLTETPTGPCTGFANTAPDHVVILKAFFRSLSLAVESPQDTALIVKGPGGTWCNDDFYGKNPGVTGQWLPGRYDIWVSTYTKNRSAPYVLRLTGR
jgi:hypothetical protein